MPTSRCPEHTAGRAGRMAAFQRDEGGAIVLLGLVALVILMMLAWVMWDAGEMGRHKLDVQAAADTAAFSQAAVRARSMNKLVYANIAKRSVVGVHSMYAAMWEAYRRWYEEHVEQCQQGADASCQLVESNRDIAEGEWEDLEVYRDDLGEQYYLQDIIAIDSYQGYIHALTPWWGWSEAVLRGARNGAHLAASFPVPGGTDRGNQPLLGSIVDQVLDRSQGSPINPFTGRFDTLPTKVGCYNSSKRGAGCDRDRATTRAMYEGGMDTELTFRQHEYQINRDLHEGASEGAAATEPLLRAGDSKFVSALMTVSRPLFGVYGRPWRLFEVENEANWTTLTSNLVMTYRREEELFGEMRDKFNVPADDYHLDDEQLYRSQGYWGMARAEISFQGGFRPPSLWHPRWTARVRPVALPGEFQQAGIEMSNVYHDMLPFFALSGVIISGNDDIVRDSMDDLVFMERANRALGHSTIEGVAK